jgi:two-component system, NarL family, invasion response regulator UvrY
MASVLIVEDHHVVAKAVQDALSMRGHQVVGHCRHADEVLAVAAETDHDLVLMNLCMDHQYGIGVALTKSLVQRNPAERVLIFTAVGRAAVDPSRSVGAAGYLHKAATSDELVHAIQIVAAGSEYWPADEA